MDKKPTILDLCCCAGGAARGYADAGFRVIGVDTEPQPHYPYEFYQADGLQVLNILLDGKSWQGLHLGSISAIHVSAPCQEYSASRFLRDAVHPEAEKKQKLIAPFRERLVRTGLPWVIENVVGSDLPDAVELCGSMFGLPIRRHRWFSSSHLMFAPCNCRHTKGFYNPIGGKVRGYGTLASNKTYKTRTGAVRKREGSYKLAVGQQAMGIDWMSLHELSQAIPPAYTAWIGQFLMQALIRNESEVVA